MSTYILGHTTQHSSYYSITSVESSGIPSRNIVSICPSAKSQISYPYGN